MNVDLSDLRNFDTPLFPIAVAAQASLISPGTMRSWFQRKRIELYRGDAEYEQAALPEKAGLPRLVTLRTALTLGAAGALVRAGADVTNAYSAAKAWTYVGQGWDGSGESPRDPACLFPEPNWSFLVYHGGQDARVIAVVPQADSLPIKYSDLFASGGRIPNAPTIVFLNKVDLNVRGVCNGYLRGTE